MLYDFVELTRPEVGHTCKRRDRRPSVLRGVG